MRFQLSIRMDAEDEVWREAYRQTMATGQNFLGKPEGFRKRA
jgi:hypothetical protein